MKKALTLKVASPSLMPRTTWSLIEAGSTLPSITHYSPKKRKQEGRWEIHVILPSNWHLHSDCSGEIKIFYL